ncbi:21061_t:CDS:2 [Cetraspora pellucida]|uniref:21061_t:CDS:1 n=1 Tax=Cetraspora pellucida TaxID=1433469 RepID=A0A9N8ZA91_9GLOM|nr:21061_t:CDS:2 [Cetraspora pellucida]
MRQYLHLVQNQHFMKMDASKLLAESLGKGPWYARLIRTWANQWKNQGKLIKSKHGQHIKIKSLIHNKNVQLQINQYLETNKFKLTISNFINYVSSIMLTFGITYKTTISRSTACKWLKLLGWKYQIHTKKMFFDSHEREDVVEYRNHFLQKMASLQSQMATYEGENLEQVILPELSSDMPEIVPVTQDETMFYAKNGMKMYWSPKGEYTIRNSTNDPSETGPSIHVSDFTCESIGCLKLSEYECTINNLLSDYMCLKYTKACITIHPDVNRDGWWTTDNLVEQIALFMFDHSSNYSSFAEDALLVTQMGMRNGTKKPLLRNCVKPDVTEHIMTYVDNNGVVRPKGIKLPDPNNLDCCTSRILSAQPDFAAQKSHLQEVIEAASHMCIFYPKYYCELNYIESFWAEAKRYARLNCDYTFKDLKKTVPKALNSIDLTKIRHFTCHSARFMSAYELGLSRKAAIFAVRKYHSHHRVLKKVLEEFDECTHD